VLRSELGGNGSELDSETSGNRWSPYRRGEGGVGCCRGKEKGGSGEGRDGEEKEGYGGFGGGDEDDGGWGAVVHAE
jgi:hypothetical protein